MQLDLLVLLEWCCSKSSWPVCFCTTNTSPWSRARASQVRSDSTNVASFLCRPSKCDCCVDKWRKKRQWQMLLNAPWTLLAPLWTIFKAFPDLKCDCKATSQRNSGKYFIVTTCQPRSSAWSQICPSFPAQMELFLRRSCHQGFGADFLFYGSCQTAPRRLFHGIPEASLNCQENVSTFTANIMRHLHSE